MSGREHSKNAYPYIEHGIKPTRRMETGEHPEEDAVGSEQQQTAHEQVAKADASPNADINGNEDTHYKCSCNVHIGKLLHCESGEEEAISHDPSYQKGRDHQE